MSSSIAPPRHIARRRLTGAILLMATCVLALPAFVSGAERASEPAKSLAFTKRHLFINPYESCAVADLNKDGHLDIVYGAHVLWGPDFVPQAFRPNHVAKEYMRANSDHAYDVDKDGWLDIIAGGWNEDGIYWYRNPGTSAADRQQPWDMHLPWEARLLAKTRGTMEMFVLHDFDKDGIPELHSANYRTQAPLEVWRFTKGSDGAPALTPFVLGAEGGGHGYAFGDVNGDGREDVLTEVGWYERPPGDPFARAWTFHPETALPHPSCPFVVKDLNRDGRLDIIFGRGHDVGLYWWEQQAPKPDGTTVWKSHTIDESWSQAHAIALADLDGDGEEELIAGKCIWAHDGDDPGAADPPGIYYYAWNRAGSTFTRHTISDPSARIALGRQYSVIDLNRDGRLDLTAPSKQGLWVFFNQGYAQTAAPQPTAAQAPAAQQPAVQQPASPTTTTTDAPLIQSAMFTWEKLAPTPTKIGARRHVVRAPSATLAEFESHITTLNVGQQSHAPHTHPNEELIILKEGTAEAYVNGTWTPMSTGSMVFFGSNVPHAIRNAGDTPATYYVVNWATPGMKKIQ